MRAPRGFDNINAIKSDGTPVIAVLSGASKGCTLANATTYYFPIGGEQSELIADQPLGSAHISWAAAVVATITLETSDYPAFEHGMESGPADVNDYDATGPTWVPCNPSAATVDVTGSGNSATGATVTAGGTNAGGAMYNIGNLGTRRARLKVVVTTGGLVRCGVHGKAATRV
jgi:hypothetical protein